MSWSKIVGTTGLTLDLKLIMLWTAFTSLVRCPYSSPPTASTAEIEKKKNTSPTLEEKKALFYVSVSGWGDSALPPCTAEGVGEAEKHVYLSAQLQFDLESTSCNCHTSELATWQISKTTMFVLVLFFLLIFPLRFIPSISFTLRSDEPWWKAAWHLKRLWSF